MVRLDLRRNQENQGTIYVIFIEYSTLCAVPSITELNQIYKFLVACFA